MSQSQFSAEIPGLNGSDLSETQHLDVNIKKTHRIYNEFGGAKIHSSAPRSIKHKPKLA